MFHNHPLAPVQGPGNGFRQFPHLGEAVFKADIHMVGVGGKESPLLILLQKGQGADIDPVVIVGQFQAGKHAPDQGAFAGARLPDHADQLVKGRQIQLRQLHAQGIHPAGAPGGEIGADNVAFLAIIHSAVLPFPLAGASPGPDFSPLYRNPRRLKSAGEKDCNPQHYII